MYFLVIAINFLGWGAETSCGKIGTGIRNRFEVYSAADKLELRFGSYAVREPIVPILQKHLRSYLGVLLVGAGDAALQAAYERKVQVLREALQQLAYRSPVARICEVGGRLLIHERMQLQNTYNDVKMKNFFEQQLLSMTSGKIDCERSLPILEGRFTQAFNRWIMNKHIIKDINQGKVETADISLQTKRFYDEARDPLFWTLIQCLAVKNLHTSYIERQKHCVSLWNLNKNKSFSDVSRIISTIKALEEAR